MVHRNPPPPEDPRLALARRRVPLHTIETVLLASTACLLAAVAWPVATGGLGAAPSEPPAAVASPTAVQPATPDAAATIQVALLLDTSGSMHGLIDQARSRLWTVANALEAARYRGGRARLEVAVYEYGSDGSAEAGHIRQVIGFTSELDEVSRALFSLSTLGGEEYAPLAIARAADGLEWRSGDDVLRVLYVAGNESFEQGPMPWADGVAAAVARGVVVNTVYCGDEDDGDVPLWRLAAERGGGRAFTIDHETRAEDPTTPFDARITALGVAINETYLGYGEYGSEGVANQIAQDRNSIRVGSFVSRGLSKSGSNYANPRWDLVDAVSEGAVEIGELDADALPPALRGLGVDGREAFVAARRAERAAIVAALQELQAERQAFLATAVAVHDVEAPASLDGAMIAAVTEQAARAGFTLDGR